MTDGGGMTWFERLVAQQHGAITAAMCRLEVAVERRGVDRVVDLRSRTTRTLADGSKYSIWRATMTLGATSYWVVLRGVVPGKVVILSVWPTLPEAIAALDEAVEGK